MPLVGCKPLVDRLYLILDCLTMEKIMKLPHSLRALACRSTAHSTQQITCWFDVCWATNGVSLHARKAILCLLIVRVT